MSTAAVVDGPPPGSGIIYLQQLTTRCHVQSTKWEAGIILRLGRRDGPHRHVKFAVPRRAGLARAGLLLAIDLPRAILTSPLGQ